MLPAVAQGAIGIQCRENDPTFEKYLAGLCHQETKVREGRGGLRQEIWRTPPASFDIGLGCGLVPCGGGLVEAYSLLLLSLKKAEAGLYYCCVWCWGGVCLCCTQEPRLTFKEHKQHTQARASCEESASRLSP